MAHQLGPPLDLCFSFRKKKRKAHLIPSVKGRRRRRRDHIGDSHLVFYASARATSDYREKIQTIRTTTAAAVDGTGDGAPRDQMSPDRLPSRRLLFTFLLAIALTSIHTHTTKIKRDQSRFLVENLVSILIDPRARISEIKVESVCKRVGGCFFFYLKKWRLRLV